MKELISDRLAAIGNWFTSIKDGIRDTIDTIGNWLVGIVVVIGLSFVCAGFEYGLFVTPHMSETLHPAPDSLVDGFEFDFQSVHCYMLLGLNVLIIGIGIYTHLRFKRPGKVQIVFSQRRVEIDVTPQINQTQTTEPASTTCSITLEHVASNDPIPPVAINQS